MKRAKVELLKKIHGGQTCQIVATAARLGLFDAFKDESLSIQKLSTLLEVNQKPLKRLCKSLVALYLLEEPVQNHYRITEQGKYLNSSHPDSIKDIAIYKGSPLIWNALGLLYEGIRSNRSPFELAFETDLFTHLNQTPDHLEIFQKAMSQYVHQGSKSILNCYPFHKITTLVDLGGGLGDFLSVLSEKYPHLDLTLFEMPHVLSLVKKSQKTFKFSQIPGSFFESIPPGFDAYLLRNILHDWNDEQCIKILSNIRKTMPKSARILLLESILPENSNSRLGKFADISMFVLTPGGKERSESEWRELVDRSQLSIAEIYKTTGSKAIIELKK